MKEKPDQFILQVNCDSLQWLTQVEGNSIQCKREV